MGKLTQKMLQQWEMRMERGVACPSEDAIREASDFCEKVLREDDFQTCFDLAQRFDTFRQRGQPAGTASESNGTHQPAIRDIVLSTSTKAVQLPVYTTDAPYPTSNAEIQVLRHGAASHAPTALHLVITTQHFHRQQGEKWVTEVLHNYRPLKGKPLTAGDLEFLDFVMRHKQPDNWDQLCGDWNATHPKAPRYKLESFKRRWRRLQERLEPPGVVVQGWLPHISVLLTHQGGDYTATVLMTGPQSTAATPDKALTDVLHAVGASSKEADLEEYQGRNA